MKFIIKSIIFRKFGTLYAGNLDKNMKKFEFLFIFTIILNDDLYFYQNEFYL